MSPAPRCLACRAETDTLSPGELFVVGMLVARVRPDAFETLCARHRAVWSWKPRPVPTPLAEEAAR